MNMLVRTSEGAWHQAEPAGFAAETEFQALVEETFGQVLATQSDAPALIAREVPMPDGGRVDILAIDADGVITVCECKLQTNAGIRREVVGQVLEYAANLNGMSFREFRARVETRLSGGDLIDSMAERAGEDWDGEVWLDQVSSRLETGTFRLVVAVDKMAPTLKQTVLYLNGHSPLPVLAVELQRGRYGTTEVLVPTVFAEEQARRKVPTPSDTADIENADTVVVAATNAWPEYERTGAYICQPERSFRPTATYLGFYAHRRIERVFPRIVAFRKNLRWSSETVAELRVTGDSEDARVADIIEEDLASPESLRTQGMPHQVVLLDPAQGFELPHEIAHHGQAAWLRGQRYTSSDALKTAPATTDELRAGGG
jgi:hypothetical protein